MTQDFLQLLAGCLGAVDADDSLVGISAWNVNGLYSLYSPLLSYTLYRVVQKNGYQVLFLG